jgi:hypothetical protein
MMILLCPSCGEQLQKANLSITDDSTVICGDCSGMEVIFMRTLAPMIGIHGVRQILHPVDGYYPWKAAEGQ